MRKNSTYRGARRQAWRDRDGKFPWPNHTARYAGLPPPRTNTRDRSKAAEAKRDSQLGTINFLNDLQNFEKGVYPWLKFDTKPVVLPKPKRGWAAQFRKAPFKNFFDEEGMHKAGMRHKWYRRVQSLRELDEALNRIVEGG